MRTEVGNPIEMNLINTTLEVCGINSDTLWLNCEKIASGTLIEREAYLKVVKERFN